MATSLQDEIRTALIRARKGRDRVRTVVISGVLSDIRNREIEVGGEADDEMVRDVLARGIKQRRDSSEQMRAGGRSELAEKEESEADILREFLPPPLEEEEVRAIVQELIREGTTGVGPLMGQLIPQIRGRFDGKDANRIVREELDG